jgi:hypothetical protein
VNAEKRQYPRYFKDSILNTNEDFDYGPFKKLEDMIINQNITVQTFSFIFKDDGIFVFENAASGTITIIAVVKKSQTCSNSYNGISASMVTPESLAEIGVKSYNKEIDPNWHFIIGTFVIIHIIVYLVIGLFILAYNMRMQQSTLRQKSNQSRTVYYDRIQEMIEAELGETCANCFKKCRKQKK